jgi:hypothetical protein
MGEWSKTFKEYEISHYTQEQAQHSPFHLRRQCSRLSVVLTLQFTRHLGATQLKLAHRHQRRLHLLI